MSLAVGVRGSGDAPVLRELASGVDALYLSGRCEPSPTLLADLEAAKSEAQAHNEAAPFELAGEAVLVQPAGWRMYPYVVAHPLGRVGFRPAGRVPPVRVQPVAESLHGLGPAAVVSAFDAFVGAAVAGVDFSVARLDLFGDFVGWQLSASMRERFLCRARRLVTHHDGEVCTGFQFGTRKAKAFTARIYDKTVDIDAKGAAWVRDLLWGDDFDGGEPVHRVEFEVGRKGLDEMQVRTPAQVLEAVGDVWRYCSHDWLTLRRATGDSVKSRWPLDPSWETVQGASQLQAVLGLARIREAATAAHLERLTPYVVGYLASLGALLNRTTLASVLSALPMLVAQHETRTGVTFSERVSAKRKAWGLDAPK